MNMVKLDFDLGFCDDIMKAISNKMRHRIIDMLKDLDGMRLNLQEMFYKAKDCCEDRPLYKELPVYHGNKCCLQIEELYIEKDFMGECDCYFISRVNTNEVKMALWKLSYEDLYRLIDFIQYYSNPDNIKTAID